jgi:hypothetical protein
MRRIKSRLRQFGRYLSVAARRTHEFPYPVLDERGFRQRGDVRHKRLTSATEHQRFQPPRPHAVPR